MNAKLTKYQKSATATHKIVQTQTKKRRTVIMTILLQCGR